MVYNITDNYSEEEKSMCPALLQHNKLQVGLKEAQFCSGPKDH